MDRPGFSNPCRCQLCHTLGGINLTVDIEDSSKKIVLPISAVSNVQHVIPAVHHSHSVVVLHISAVFNVRHVIPAVHHSHNVIVLPISAVFNVRHVIPAVHHSHSVMVLPISAVSNSMSFLLSITLTVLLFFLFQPCPTACHSCCPPLSQCCCSSYFSRVQCSACHSCCPLLSQCCCSSYFSRVQQHVIPAIHHSHSVVLSISAMSNSMSFLLSTTLTVLLFFLFQPCPTACNSCCPPLSQGCCSSYFSRVQCSACHSCCLPLSQCCSSYFSRVQQHVIPAIHHSHSVVVFLFQPCPMFSMSFLLSTTLTVLLFFLFQPCPMFSMSFLLSTTLTVLLFFLFQPCSTACHSCCPLLSQCCCSSYFSHVQQHVVPAIHHSHNVIVLPISAVFNVRHVIPAVHHSHSVMVLPISAVSNSMSFLLSITLTVLLFFLFQPCPTACHSCCPPLSQCCCSSYFSRVQCSACHSCCPLLSQCCCSSYFSRVQQHVIPAVHSHSVVVLPISAVSNSM